MLKKKFHFLFFIFYFITSISIYDDYGINFDEQANRNYGFITGNYVLENFLPKNLYNKIFSNITSSKFSDEIEKKSPPKLTDESFFEKAYGVTFELPSAVLETILNINDKDKVYKFRHLLIFVVFFISTIFFYKLCYLLSKDKVISLLFTFSLIIHPRIFSDQFHNSKDLIFLSYLIISIFFVLKVIKKYSIKNIILFAFITALCFGHKIIGIIVLFSISMIFLFQQSRLNVKKKIQRIFIITSITLLLCYAFWPYLWEDPIVNLKSAFQLFSKFKWVNEIPFMGKFISSDKLPWYYIPIFFLITTPPYILIIIFSGILILFYQIISYRKNKLYVISLVQILFLSQIFLIPLLFAIFNNSILYDGWRHFLFIYPLLLIISLISISSIIYSFKTKFFYFLLIALIITGGITQTYWNFKYHPFQHSYFNKVFYERPNEIFESDYWGVSNKYLIDKVISLEKSKKIFYKFESSNFKLSLDILENEKKNRFIEYSNLDETNYYYLFVLKRFKTFDRKIFENLRRENEVISEVIINNTVINGVYKIKNKSLD